MAAIKNIFIAWEKLRILYIIILTVETLYIILSMIKDIFFLELWLYIIIGAIIANILYLLGPITEYYFYWLGVKHIAIRITLFISGLLLAIFLTFLYLVAFFLEGFTIP